MKTTLFFLLSTFSFGTLASDIYQYDLISAKKKEIKLSGYKGKAVLIVNIATKCGYTAQLEGLEEIYQKYKNQGLTVIGVPSNDFGGQTPESNEEVVKFCKLNYGVTFPLTQKTIVKGDKKSALYKYLTGLTDNTEISWNFTKFLFDKKGKLVNRYSSVVAPNDKGFIKDVRRSVNNMSSLDR